MRHLYKRNFKNIDWSISIPLLFAVALTFIVACVDSSGPIGAPDVIPMGTTVSSVKLTLAQPMLALGQTTQASVIATLSDGSLVSGPVDFSSQNPSVATVSSKGVVTALTAGVTMINAAVSSHAASAAITVKPLAPPSAVVAVVAVALDSTSLAISHSARASATVMDSAGNLIPNQAVTWASLAPTVATVSPTGTVTAVGAGLATIEASVPGKTGSASLTVLQVPVYVPASGILAFQDFNDGTPGSFMVSSRLKVDFPNDPTGSGHGKIARILYGPVEANRSDEEYVSYVTHDSARIRYGRTIWFKGEVYLPSNPLNDPNWRASDLRKILDWQGASDDGMTGGGARFILHSDVDQITGHPCLSLEVEAQTTIGGVPQASTIQYYAQFSQDAFGFDAWHTIEVRLITNTSDSSPDGSLAFWIDNSSDTPTFVTPATLKFINESWAPKGSDGQPRVGSYFSALEVGSQLSNATPLPLNHEYRYWDNITFSTQRVGH
jgi:hypothetical protein